MLPPVILESKRLMTLPVENVLADWAGGDLQWGDVAAVAGACASARLAMGRFA